MDFQSVYDQAWQLRNEEAYDKANALAHKGLSRAKEMDDALGQALMLKIIAQVHHDNNELDLALKTYKKIEPIYIDLKMQPQQMHALRHIGNLFLELGKAECAEKCLVQVVENYEEHETPQLEKANAYYAYAMSLKKRGKTDEASAYEEKSKDIYNAYGIDLDS